MNAQLSRNGYYDFMFQANHDFDPNTCYGIFLSPRFGYIRAVYALRSIRRGEEITVNYGYNVKTVGDCNIKNKTSFYQ